MLVRIVPTENMSNFRDAIMTQDEVFSFLKENPLAVGYYSEGFGMFSSGGVDEFFVIETGFWEKE